MDDSVMESWPQLENVLITPSRMYTISEKDDIEVLSVIDPQRGAGEPGMAHCIVR